MPITIKAENEKPITLKEFEEFNNLLQNENERYEFIDGFIYSMASPSSTHADIIGYLHANIFNYLIGKPCKTYMNLDIRLKLVNIAENNEDKVDIKKKEKNVFIPDLFINCKPGRIKTNYCLGAPEFVLEVISPSTKKRDYYLKHYQYLMNGVEEYWVIDHDSNRITVFTPDFIKEYTFSDKVPITIFNGDLVIDFAELSKTL